ncbi:ABC transporter ATP-binding protein [Xanthomonas sp. MUS 060]|uniref:ABC transporter ATP-binding protein n=1 Tax=Xanthomonas sp. MUS 060 TaxID=1588031 RepID=UPI0005F2D8ED|nr:ABC transporter ATP-binding protein [Xanthomonas sp. MUS 060]
MNDQCERPLIRLELVSKVFQSEEIETHALSSVNIEIKKGEYVSISGPSGCGKSTLLSILGLLDAPSSGTYYSLNGTAIQSLSAGQRAKVRNREIGFIFQAFNLIGDLSIFENVELPLVYLEGEQALSRKQRKERVLEVLEQVGIAHRVNHYPAQLSGGQQQRVAVARALVTRPAVLLADEPTGNLDSHNGEAVIALLDQLHRSGSTICMVTHDLRHAKFAQRSIYMFDGRVVDEEMLTSLRRKEEDMIDERLNLARSSRT